VDFSNIRKAKKIVASSMLLTGPAADTACSLARDSETVDADGHRLGPSEHHTGEHTDQWKQHRSNRIDMDDGIQGNAAEESRGRIAEHVGRPACADSCTLRESSRTMNSIPPTSMRVSISKYRSTAQRIRAFALSWN